MSLSKSLLKIRKIKHIQKFIDDHEKHKSIFHKLTGEKASITALRDFIKNKNPEHSLEDEETIDLLNMILKYKINSLFDIGVQNNPFLIDAFHNLKKVDLLNETLEKIASANIYSARIRNLCKGINQLAKYKLLEDDDLKFLIERTKYKSLVPYIILLEKNNLNTLKCRKAGATPLYRDFIDFLKSTNLLSKENFVAVSNVYSEEIHHEIQEMLKIKAPLLKYPSHRQHIFKKAIKLLEQGNTGIAILNYINERFPTSDITHRIAKYNFEVPEFGKGHHYPASSKQLKLKHPLSAESSSDSDNNSTYRNAFKNRQLLFSSSSSSSDDTSYSENTKESEITISKKMKN